MHSERRAGSILRIATWIAITAVTAWSQTPAVSSVVDAASYEPTLGAPGALATIFGTNLAAAAATAQALPLPTELGGTQVTWNGVAAPLLYVSPTQINFQVPTPDDETPGVLVVTGVVVSTAAGNSAPYNPATATPDAWQAGGIFSLNASGCGPGAILNVASDGSTSLNSTSNSAQPGEWISVYGTGLTAFYAEQFPPDGTPAPANPPEEGYMGVDAAFDFATQPANLASSSWAGLAPDLVGLDQFNVQIPAGVREGCAVPLQAQYYGNAEAVTQPVTLAIRSGGGPCVDPPAAGYGQITWQKTVATTPASPNSGQSALVSESDTVTVSLQSSPGQQAPPAPVFGQGVPSSTTLFGPACPVSGYRSLDAGTVTAQEPSLSSSTQIPSAPFQQGQLAGISAYQATLPNGTIQAGQFTVTADGGADVGAFQAALQIGADIQIQTSLEGAEVFQNCAPLTVNWTGGDPLSWVTVKLIQSAPASAGGYQTVGEFSGQARVSAGTVSVSPVGSGIPGQACEPITGPVVISVEVDPDPSEVAAFSAPGLSLGGQSSWKYVHTFQAVFATE